MTSAIIEAVKVRVDGGDDRYVVEFLPSFDYWFFYDRVADELSLYMAADEFEDYVPDPGLNCSLKESLCTGSGSLDVQVHHRSDETIYATWNIPDEPMRFTYDPKYRHVTLLVEAPANSYSQADFHSIREQVAGPARMSA